LFFEARGSWEMMIMIPRSACLLFALATEDKACDVVLGWGCMR
jgi:hypothetical protein